MESFENFWKNRKFWKFLKNRKFWKFLKKSKILKIFEKIENFVKFSKGPPFGKFSKKILPSRISCFSKLGPQTKELKKLKRCSFSFSRSLDFSTLRVPEKTGKSSPRINVTDRQTDGHLKFSFYPYGGRFRNSAPFGSSVSKSSY